MNSSAIFIPIMSLTDGPYLDFPLCPTRKNRHWRSWFAQFFLGSAAENPDLVTAYLAEKAQTDRRRRIYREGIMESATALARDLPSAFVDFMLAAFLNRPEDIGSDPFYIVVKLFRTGR
ncbi:MAG: hypothetical protein CBARDCOR_4062 [uncultured Caballeronia sp.]|nr:MAG: hypothetical protein CBARDCOR_4062 [uncultured Caballeronia sp.]